MIIFCLKARFSKQFFWQLLELRTRLFWEKKAMWPIIIQCSVSNCKYCFVLVNQKTISPKGVLQIFWYHWKAEFGGKSKTGFIWKLQKQYFFVKISFIKLFPRINVYFSSNFTDFGKVVASYSSFKILGLQILNIACTDWLRGF